MSVGEVKGRTYVKLLEALVGSVLMYGAEVWRCCRQLDSIEQIQLRVCRIFLGVGRLHPKTSLQIEMGMRPLRWEAEIRCTKFWHRVLNMGEVMLVKRPRAAMEVLSLRGGVKWWRNLELCLADLGWWM